VLIGRDTEQERVDRLLAGARAGTAGTLAVVGPAGLGKTALLEHARDVATGFRVLRAVGSAAEQTIGLAGLGALLRPLLGAVGELPTRQRHALEDAFALSDPPSSGPDPLTLGSGVLALLTSLGGGLATARGRGRRAVVGRREPTGAGLRAAPPRG
jgi:hypothetical protein